MPVFSDRNGTPGQCDEYPGNSYRATVVNRALRQHDFVWVTVNNGQRVQTFPMFTCSHCHTSVTAHGVQGDHIISQADGGTDSLWNLQILCTTCNAANLHHGNGPIATRTRGAIRGRAQNRW